MQVGMFKKAKGGWLEEFFAGLARSPILCRPIENTQRAWKNNPVKIELKGQEKMLHPPEIAFRLDSKLILKLRDRLERTRRPLQGLLVADSLNAPIGSFVELRSPEEDAGAVQEAEGVFCVGVALSKGEGDAELQKRVKEELRRCSERSGVVFSQNSNDSQLSELSRATIRQLRMFLFFDQGREGLSVGRLLFFPRASILLRNVNIMQPSGITANDVMEHIKKTLNFSKQLAYGYISLNGDRGGKHKFILLDRNDPELINNSLHVLGVWAAGALGTGLQREAAIWSFIMEYLTDPHLTKRLSVAGERTGLFFSFEYPQEKGKLNLFTFQFPNSARWSISTRLEFASKIPEEYTFSQQEVIMEEEKEESEVESISSRQDKARGLFDETSEGAASARLLEEKDAEIKRLKVELEFYKGRCEKLQEALNNLNVLQLAQKTLTTTFPYSPYRNSPDDQEEPFFGTRPNDDEPEQPRPKEFVLRDTKNISFAQDASFDEELPSSSILKVTTPEFKDTRQSKPPVRAFNFARAEDEENRSKIREEKEREEKAREEQRAKEQRAREERAREEERARQEQRRREEQREKERAELANKTSSSIRSFDEKYGSYKPPSKISVNKISQSPADSPTDSRRNENEKPTASKQDPPRKAAFQEQPRDRRIKNQLYEQDKSPKKEIPFSANFTKPRPAEVKSPERNNRSKSPIPQEPQRPHLDSDDDDDAELRNIIASRKNK